MAASDRAGAGATAGLGEHTHVVPGAISGGMRSLRDGRSYLAAIIVIAMTFVPAVVLWVLAAGLALTTFGDPWGPSPTAGEAGLAVLVGLLVLVLSFIGYFWTYMTLAVRAASVAVGEPLGVWESVTTGFVRTMVAIASWLLVALVGIPLLIIYILARVMADVVVLSAVSVLLTAVLAVALIAWSLAIFLTSSLVTAFAAADRSAGIMTVLRRALGLTRRHPATVILVILAVGVAVFALTFVLYGPAFFAGSVGFTIVTEMEFGGRSISAGILGIFLILLIGVVVVLVPLNFGAGALANFGVLILPELRRIEAERERGRAQPASASPAPWTGAPTGSPQGAQPSTPPDQGPPPSSPPEQGPPPSSPPEQGPPPSSPPNQGPPPDAPPPQGPPRQP